MGSPDFAVPTLAALVEAGHEIACVYSQPPKPAGRGKTLRPTAVHAWAEARGIKVRTPANLKAAEAQAEFAALSADAAIVVAYGLILPKAVLDATRLGCFNLHGSLLPRWRGAAPMQRAIEAGDVETGVQVMAMEVGLDTGGIYATARTSISAQDTTGTLHDRLTSLGAALMVEALPQIAAGALPCVPQAEDGITYAAKIDRAETKIDWAKPAHVLDRAIRAFSPVPGAWCLLPDGARAKILLCQVEAGEGAPGTALDDRILIACGQGALRLLKVQREGKGALDATDFLRGNPVSAGDIFS
ncbi:methionyl-tRNA formyltransferase [Aquidulcibacter sp.]|jgi:methionyl-tRNA formyltransferase|uniref:methionyl-tRNA formyltransferase n=1 Tax=Aquidulcibacter sp. TaxID=2052990 RepID=UPI0028AE10EF|nr:methionyl-tRNA formyltransferase [Aquidulcibacter sp.]